MESAVTENSAAYLSARASNLSLFVKSGSSSDGVVIEKPPKDSDYQFKYVWSIAANQKLTVAASGATDSLGLNVEAGSEAASEYPDVSGNAGTDTRYNSQMLAWDLASGSGTQLHIAVGHSTSNNDTSYGDGYFYNESLTRDSGIIQFDSSLNPFHTVHFTGELVRNEHGADYDQALYICNEFDPTCNDTRRGFVIANQSLTETGRTLALSDTWRVARALDADVGAQLHENSFTREHFINPRAALR